MGGDRGGGRGEGVRRGGGGGGEEEDAAEEREERRWGGRDHRLVAEGEERRAPLPRAAAGWGGGCGGGGGGHRRRPPWRAVAGETPSPIYSSEEKRKKPSDPKEGLREACLVRENKISRCHVGRLTGY